MPKIKLLPPDVAQKIAAGEVIERPVSVVKELVENSLDAEATEIRVELLDGGKKLIRVQDNGLGMSSDDAALSFRRHSTSKISSEEDLERIATLGFRGEALASVSAVSRLILKTYDGSGDRGTQVEREGERLLGIQDTAFPKGTSVEVRDLFFNLPARRKFLRSDRSELGPIVKYLTHVALAFPGIRFYLSHGPREILNCPQVTSLKERIFQLYGRSVLEGLMEVDYEEGDSRVSGFASRPLGGRADRSLQLFYVNRRPVKDRVLQAALNQAFVGLLEKNKSAEAFLFLNLPFSEVDVNVHPAKAEVRFKDSQFIFRLVLRAIEKAAIRDNRIKGIALSKGLPLTEGAGSPAKGLPFGRPGFKVEEPALPVYFKRGEGKGSGDAPPWGTQEQGLTGAVEPGEPAAVPRAAKTGPAVLGQYLDTYIVAASEDGILVIDQHNAHERVLYEKYLEISSGERWPRKMLLVPPIFDLSPLQGLTLEGARDLFEEAGFVVEAIGGRSYALKEFPEIFNEAEAKDVFLALLEEVGAEKAPGKKEKLLAGMACKSAVKAGQPLPKEKMEYLLAELFRTSQPSLCPHGRPIVVKIGKPEIEKGLRR